MKIINNKLRSNIKNIYTILATTMIAACCVGFILKTFIDFLADIFNGIISVIK